MNKITFIPFCFTGVLLLIGACVVSGNVPNSASASASASSSSQGDCSPGATRCDGEQPQTCNDAGVFEDSTPAACVGPYYCDTAIQGDGCNCDAGATWCDNSVQGKPTEFVCVAGAGGVNSSQGQPCKSDEACVDALGECTPVGSKCLTIGHIECDSNITWAQQCQVDPSTGVAKYISMLDCSTVYYRGSCNTQTEQSAAISEWCVNECGGHEVLDQHKCDKDKSPALSCSTLHCNVSTGKLEGDHTGCLDDHVDCTDSRECKSCNCIAGKCDPNSLPCSEFICP